MLTMPSLSLLTLLQDPAPTTGTTPSTTQAPSGASAPAQPSALLQFLPLVAVVAIFYFVMILPERKQRKKREAMLAAVKKGDRVMTTSGMFAVVAAINEDEITLQIDEGVRARFSRAAIQQVVEDAPAKADKS